MIKLQNRLKTAADLVACGGVCIDIGSDHAYLPAYLISEGICTRGIAADIGQLPLQNARATLCRYGLLDKIELRLSDGLDAFSPKDGDEIIIAGMGGTLITDILSRAPWLKDSSKHLILQPMTHSEEVRRFLSQNDFYIEEERAVCDEGRCYNVISARYSPDKEICKTEGFYYIGRLAELDSDEAKIIINKQIKRVKSRIEGLRSCGRLPDELAQLETAYEELKHYENC